MSATAMQTSEKALEAAACSGSPVSHHEGARPFEPLKFDTENATDTEDDDTVAAIPPGSTSDPVFEAKARVLNRALQAIGMGRYQWQLFVVVGSGGASDTLCPIFTSLILPAVATEFSPQHAPLLTLAQNVGLLAGAIFWGFGCDIFGRRW